ncbi:protein transport protein Sec31A isoform X6 [Salvelinus sp. IW2-2015]|uniref:protein transport protein Sec31A isoform X6 n=1 Tax=Salvelinus sp. IW2-2015 TaxID=2691554 RepID=UPI000CDF9BBA|nr:protein transport protein Sec31A isoform X7 [Salvelinus alpinus]
MKLKEINRTAVQSWSPAQHHPVYLAAGTSAQQLDASFSTSASLEIFELDLAEPSLDMKLRGAYSSSHRYHKLAWGPHGMDAQGLPSGVLIAGGENGDVILYDPAKIIAGDSDVVIAQSNKHSGPVRALDVNSFQTNLVASGGNESEIYIWDLNNFGSPMTPGPKTQPLEDISCVAWNRQVQHILASASPSGRASIWDLRKNDLIIKVSDHSNRMHCSGLEWNPEVATQLVLASEDDRMPVIQIWDLRFATSPLKVLENHTRGILAIAWSLADPELLLSCGKDNRILCWNPNTAEVLYELPTSTQWCFDIQWCPRNPAVLSAAAFDGHISVYSIMGGSSQAVSQTQADTISTSFGNMDPFGMGQTLPPLQLSQAPPASTTITPLKKPPKWIRRPVGASFAFGGKLVSLENIKPNPQQPQQPTAHVVYISQVITETTFLERSAHLQATLAAGSFIDFCQEKMDSAQNEFEKTVWAFLKVNFENDARGKYLKLLGYKKEELAAKIAAALEGEPIQPEEEAAPPVEASLPGETPAPVPEGIKLRVSQGVDGLITQALLTGDFQGAVDLCLHDNRMADSIILAIAGGAELLEKTQRKYFTKTHSKITKLISAVVMGDWRDVLQTCELQNWKEALAAVMTYAQPEEFSSLCDLLGCRLEAVEDSTLQAQACLCYICAGNVEKLVSCWTRAQDGHCPLSLQDLVEKVVVLRKAVEQNQESGPSAVGLLLGERMSQYASLLASQGSLTNAIAYLPQNTEQVEVQQLRDRLSRALGQQAPAAAPVPQLPSPQPTAAQPRQLFTPAQPSMVSQQPAPAPVPAAASAPQQYYQPVRSASTVTSWSNQTPTALPSVPPPHLGPATTEPQVQPSPPMYGMPPSGSAAPPASSSAAYPPMYSHQYQPYPPASQYNRGTGGPAIYSPLQYSAPPPPSFSSSSPQAPAPGFMPQYTQQPLYPPPSMGQPVSSAPPFSPPPLSSGASFQHGGPGSPASYMPPLPPTGSSEGYNPDTTCFMEGEGPQNGWNDPPTLNRVPKKKKVPENYTPPSPITAPIFSPLGAGDPQQPPYMPPGQAQNQAPYQGMQQQTAPPPMNPGMLKTRGGSVEGAPGAPTGDIIQPLQSIPAEKITMKPMPDEHLVLKNTFEGLIHKCLAAATDPQTKRKLDDANKRLEALYDKLREQTLSPAIIGGLHNMVQCIESRSYVESLNIHTHIVSSSNFSETSAFMPVLKVVLTQANKLGV